MNEYWSGKGKYQKEYEELYNVLVPRSGEADTKLGEILRISGNVYYRFYNDGDVISRGLFTKMKPYEKKIKAEMTHPEYYDFYKKMVSNPSIRRDLEGRVQSEDGLEFRRVMNATIDGIIKFIYKEYKTGKLKSRKMHVDLYPPGKFSGEPNAITWIIQTSNNITFKFPTREDAEDYAKKKNWKIEENEGSYYGRRNRKRRKGKKYN